MRFILALLAVLASAATTASAAQVKKEMFVPIGGIQQWVTIKGHDGRNPVLLFLHGGPGDAVTPFADAMFAGWDKDFTLVQWDQRGAGRTFGKTGDAIAPTMTMARMTQDGVELAEYLKTHLGKKKIILMGGSWGSILGVNMVQARPDLFYAYLGTAQIVNWQRNVAASYARVLQLARDAKDDQSVAVLTTIGPPPWTALPTWAKFRKPERLYQAKLTTSPKAPETIDPAYASAPERSQWSQADDFNFVHFVGMKMDGPLTGVDLARNSDFAVPVFIVQGEQDLTAPPDLVRTWFDGIHASDKQFQVIAGAGHEPSEPLLEACLKLLREKISPLAH